MVSVEEVSVVRLCIEILHDGTDGDDGDARLPLLRNAVESLASAGAEPWGAEVKR
jgi:hypothetical protein